MERRASGAIGLLLSGSMIFLGLSLLAGGRETHAAAGGVPEAIEQVRQTMVALDQKVDRRLDALGDQVDRRLDALDLQLDEGVASLRDQIASTPATGGQILRILTATGTTGASLYVPAAPRAGTVHLELTLGGDVMPWRDCTVNFSYFPWRDPPPSYHYQLRAFTWSDDTIVGDHVYVTHHNYSNPPRLVSIDVGAGEALAVVMLCRTHEGFPTYAEFAEQHSYASIRATYLSDAP